VNDDNPGVPSALAEPTHVVTANGCFGSVSWRVSAGLYSLLNPKERDDLLDMTADNIIGPYFRHLVVRILKFIGQADISIETLGHETSLTTITLEECPNCGTVVWILSEGLEKLIDDNQFEAVRLLAQPDIHEFVGAKLFTPLVRDSMRRFRS
jgi:hypothetical protein